MGWLSTGPRERQAQAALDAAEQQRRAGRRFTRAEAEQLSDDVWRARERDRASRAETAPADGSAGTDRPASQPQPGSCGAASVTDEQLALFVRARDWMWHQNASSWVADAFGHWIIAEVAPHQAVPERLSDLWVRWNYHPGPRRYRARHAARPSGSPPWIPGQPLPD